MQCLENKKNKNSILYVYGIAQQRTEKEKIERAVNYIFDNNNASFLP